ncbi:hypothetical protein GS497_25685 [Rhodococcus hoagii]|nr:hypothetical protein [Prescottella equi]
MPAATQHGLGALEERQQAGRRLADRDIGEEQSGEEADRDDPHSSPITTNRKVRWPRRGRTERMTIDTTR